MNPYEPNPVRDAWLTLLVLVAFASAILLMVRYLHASPWMKAMAFQ